MCMCGKLKPFAKVDFGKAIEEVWRATGIRGFMEPFSVDEIWLNYVVEKIENFIEL